MLINFKPIDQTISEQPELAAELYELIRKATDQSLSLDERKQAVDLVNEKNKFFSNRFDVSPITSYNPKVKVLVGIW